MLFTLGFIKQVENKSYYCTKKTKIGKLIFQALVALQDSKFTLIKF